MASLNKTNFTFPGNDEHAQAVDELMDLEVEEIVESGDSDSSGDDIVIYSEESEKEDIEPEAQPKTIGLTYLVGNSKNFRSHVEVKSNLPKPKLLGPKCARRRYLLSHTSSECCRSPVQHVDAKPHVATRDEFLNSLGLQTVSQHEKDEKTVKKEVDIDCDIWYVDEFDRHHMCSPRSARTLMSQMSHDLESSPRKWSSFGAEEYSQYEDDLTEDYTSQIQGSLLRIPFSSLLGTRLKKNMRADSNLNIISRPEEYCGTSPRPEFTDKLRIRPQDFPVTFRRRKRGIPKHSHEIKFSKADKKKFLIRIKTGLTERSRRLKRLMKDCKVVLNRLTEDEIKRWTQPMYHDDTVWTIDDDISIVAVDIPMSNVNRQVLQQQNSSHTYKQHAGFSGMNSSARNPAYEKALADKRMECLMSEPRPCFLVKKVEKQFNANNGDTSSKMVYVPVSQHISGPSENLIGRNAIENTSDSLKRVPSSNRRKQNFQVRRELEDDGISCVKVSSGNESEKINLLKNKLNSGNFLPYRSVVSKSSENALNSAMFKKSGSVQNLTQTVHGLSGASSTAYQTSYQTAPATVRTPSDGSGVIPAVRDIVQNGSALDLQISSVYSLKTGPLQVIRKQLGRIGCISSALVAGRPSQPLATADHCKPVHSDSTVRPTTFRRSVLPTRDKHPASDDNDDCICVGEVITIDDD